MVLSIKFASPRLLDTDHGSDAAETGAANHFNTAQSWIVRPCPVLRRRVRP